MQLHPEVVFLDSLMPKKYKIKPTHLKPPRTVFDTITPKGKDQNRYSDFDGASLFTFSQQTNGEKKTIFTLQETEMA